MKIYALIAMLAVSISCAHAGKPEWEVRWNVTNAKYFDLESCMTAHMLGDGARLNPNPSLRPDRETIWTEILGKNGGQCLGEASEFMRSEIEYGKWSLTRDDVSQETKQSFADDASGENARKNIGWMFARLYNEQYQPEATAKAAKENRMKNTVLRLAGRFGVAFLIGLIIVGIGVWYRKN